VRHDGSLPPAERDAAAKRIRALRRFAEAGRVAVEAFLRSRRLELRSLEGILARAKGA
jgi:hypothetical protein